MPDGTRYIESKDGKRKAVVEPGKHNTASFFSYSVQYPTSRLSRFVIFLCNDYKFSLFSSLFSDSPFLQALIKESKYICFYTGAGISAASGVGTFGGVGAMTSILQLREDLLDGQYALSPRPFFFRLPPTDSC